MQSTFYADDFVRNDGTSPDLERMARGAMSVEKEARAAKPKEGKGIDTETPPNGANSDMGIRQERWNGSEFHS